MLKFLKKHKLGFLGLEGWRWIFWRNFWREKLKFLTESDIFDGNFDGKNVSQKMLRRNEFLTDQSKFIDGKFSTDWHSVKIFLTALPYGLTSRQKNFDEFFWRTYMSVKWVFDRNFDRFGGPSKIDAGRGCVMWAIFLTGCIVWDRQKMWRKMYIPSKNDTHAIKKIKHETHMFS